jgi:hypothetical protein
MNVGWSDKKRFIDVSLGGKRDAQYKWPMIQQEWDDFSQNEIFSDHMARTAEIDIRDLRATPSSSDTPPE